MSTNKGMMAKKVPTMEMRAIEDIPIEAPPEGHKQAAREQIAEANAKDRAERARRRG